MAHGIKFDGYNKTYGPPEGVSEEECKTLHTFFNGACVVSAWEFTPEELTEINRTGRAFLSVWSGGALLPVAVGSETAIHALVADFGAVWPLSEQRECDLFQYKYVPGKGYAVFRQAFEKEHEPTFDLNEWITNNLCAMFVTEQEARDYRRYRNNATLRMRSNLRHPTSSRNPS